jgi:hypothetical protein
VPAGEFDHDAAVSDVPVVERGAQGHAEKPCGTVAE